MNFWRHKNAGNSVLQQSYKFHVDRSNSSGDTAVFRNGHLRKNRT